MKTQPNGVASRRFALVAVTIVACGTLAVRAALPHEIQRPKPSATEKAIPLLPVTPITVHTETVQTENSVSGQVEPLHVATLAAEVANRIVARPVTQGDRVEVGAVIALLDADAVQTTLRQAKDAYAQARASRLQLETDYERTAIETRETILSAQAAVGQAQSDLQRARAQGQQAAAGERKTRTFTRQQELRQSEDALSQAKTDEKIARIDYERYVYLVKQGAAPQQTLDHAQATLDAAVARRQSAEQGVSLANEGARVEDKDAATAQVSAANAQTASAEHQVEAARAALRIAQTRPVRLAALRRQIDGLRAAEAQAQDNVRQAQIALEKHTIRAPFAGRILAALSDVGDQMTVGTPIARIGAIRQVKATFAIPESSRPALRFGQAVSVTADALPGYKFAGRITALGFQADAKSRNFPIEITIENPRESLLPNMAARLRLSVGGKSRRLMVPASAVASDGAGAYVFVLRGGKSVRRDVSLGAPLGDKVEITRGLADGEKIAATPQRLTDNAAVRSSAD